MFEYVILFIILGCCIGLDGMLGLVVRGLGFILGVKLVWVMKLVRLRLAILLYLFS